MFFKKAEIIFVLLLIIFTVSGCDDIYKKADLKNTDKNNIYVLSEKGLIYVINKSLNITNKMKLSTDSDSMDSFNNKIYAALYGYDMKPGESIEILKNGQKLKEIKLDYILPSSIKIDRERGLAYVVFAPNSSTNYTPVAVIDLKKDTVKEYIKLNDFMADLGSLSCLNGKLYAVLTGNGYYDIVSIDPDTQRITYLFNKKLLSPPSDMTFGNDGLLYAIFLNLRTDNTPELKIIDVNNKQIKDIIKLKNQYPTRIIVSDNKIYISNLNPLNLEGSTITVYNKQSGKISYINDVNGCYWMFSKNNQLFVANYKDAEIIVIDMKSDKIQKKIKLNNRPFLIISM
ncbi:MAG: hypothetical protein QME35_09670 [Thermoanaerobacteraceae bacterium]|nr:hypothetical protein [Thermoanaerobacteraceae bacterium]